MLGKVLMEVRSDLRCWISTATDGIEYIDAMDMPSNEIWAMPLQSVLQLPKIREAIDIYGLVVVHNTRDATHFNFYECTGPLEELEFLMRTNMGGGLPVAWFYEMKQDIYDMVRFNYY